VRSVDKKWSKLEVALMVAAACVAAVISATLSELNVWEKASPKLEHMRDMAEWNANFAKKPGSVVGVDQSAEKSELVSKKEAESLSAKIRDNRKHGVVPVWAGIERSKLYLLLGEPPIDLGYPDCKGSVLVYFDKNREGLIVTDPPKRLSDVSPDLQSVATKFHLKESKYVPGIFGLDPAYLHERIFKRASIHF
jgi:hypothetical protein